MSWKKGFSQKMEGKRLLGSWEGMATRFGYEDRLEEASNFSPWKKRIAFLLEEKKL